GARESFVGALSGAIFGPYGAFKSYKGMMAFGGLTNGVESLIRQTLEGKGINFKTLLLDAGIGAATAGVFHGAGKIFEKASPFVKNAFNKISSNISENTRIAKIALSNMEKGPKSVVLGSNFGNVDEALGRFTKEFKKVKSGIAGGGKATEKVSTNYKETFFKKHPDLRGEVVVHHSVEQQVLRKYPDIFTKEEIHAYESLRGIPKEVNSEVHLSKIRIEWNKFYKDIAKGKIELTKENFLNKAKVIDGKFGDKFNPKIK
ncbi:hypothetical protein, partial [Clostridium estertheticum]